MSSSDSATDRPPTINWRNSASAIRSPAAHAVLWIIAVLGLALDLGSKAWAFNNLEAGQVRTLIPGLLDAQLSLNSGALFGMGEGMVPVFIIASIAALGFVLYLFSGSSRRQHAVHVALGFIIAGALGNLYDRTFIRFDLVPLRAAQGAPEGNLIGDVIEKNDRFVRVVPWGGTVRKIDRDELAGSIKSAGVVRDFLKFTPRVAGHQIWPWVFNVADAFLVVGVCLLLLSYWIEARRMVRSATEGAAEPSGAD